MVKRKKRLQKGIESIEEEIRIHEDKMRVAEKLEQEELVGYYTKEIWKMLERKKNRGENLHRKD